jgi:hypothetical protein
MKTRFHHLCLKHLLLTILTPSSLLFYPYQVIKRLLPPPNKNLVLFFDFKGLMKAGTDFLTLCIVRL